MKTLALILFLTCPAYSQWREVYVSSTTDTRAIQENFRRASLWSSKKLDKSGGTITGPVVSKSTITASHFIGSGTGLTGVGILSGTQTWTGGNTLSSVTIGTQYSGVWPFSRVQVYTSGTGTWNVPSGVGMFKVTCVGGGGGGGTNATYGGGGGGAGCAIGYAYDVVVGSAIAYSVGAGATAGNTGGTSNLGSYCSASGGLGGGVILGGAGGAGSVGSILITGGSGGIASTIAGTGNYTGQGGNSCMGGGPPSHITGVGVVGGIYGGGGGGGTTGGTGGAGVIIIEY